MDATTWLPLLPHNPIPPDAVVARCNAIQPKILVGRAWHCGELLPATVLAEQRCAYVAQNGLEYKTSKFEILLGSDFYWQACENGFTPPQAVPFSEHRSKKNMFIGRISYLDAVRVGMVDATQGCIYFPHGGEEMCLSSYDVLTWQKDSNWLSTSFHFTPSDAVEAGYDTDKSVIYIGRALLDGQWLPAKVIPTKTCAYVSHQDSELFVRDYQILHGCGYLWHKVYGHYIPPNAVSCGVSPGGEPLYVGRGHYKGSLTPGLISVEEKCLTLTYGGRAVSVTDYEILIK